MPIRFFGMPVALILRPARWLAGALVAVAALLWLVAPAQAEVVARTVAKSPAQVRAYWTPQRMQSAEPVGLPASSGSPGAAPTRSPRANGRATTIGPTSGIAAYDFEPGSESGFPQRVHGKIFFTVPGLGDAACSGTLVASRLRNVVFTAGHCVKHSPESEWSTNLVFVPGYRDGSEPFGEFPATAMLAPDEWTLANDFSHDVAIAQLGTPLESQLGARGIAFNKAPKANYQIFGYPGAPSPPYDGERLVECDAPFFGLEEFGGHPFSTIAYPCTMREGSSGGGWVNPTGQVTSVVSHGYVDPSLDGLIAGPYFGDDVKALYNRAGGSAECPPAQQAVGKARKKLRKAGKAIKRAQSQRAMRKAKRKQRKSLKKLNKAKLLRNNVC